MRINEFFPRLSGMLSTGAIVASVTMLGSTAGRAETFTVAPTPVYGSVESQLSTHYRGPGLPGGEAMQSVSTGPRHPVFDVAGYDGVVYAPVTPAYNAAATFRTYAGQPGNGANAVLAQSVDGSP